jgi:quercetin dioxygenase-like cupin family protein
MHHVGTVATAPVLDSPYGGRARGYRRIALVDRAAGSVHQLLALGELDAGGSVDAHAHASEKAIYLLEGELVLEIDGASEALRPDDHLFLAAGAVHAARNPGAGAARWLELLAPQPAAALSDPAFPAGQGAGEGGYVRGRFDASQLPPPSDTIGLEGFGAANVGGAALTMLIDREHGASQFNLFVVEYAPGGLIKEHDHPFEEAFFFVSGTIEAELDGETHVLRAGDYCWSGVCSPHSFRNVSDAPVRWIETQVPQPPSRHQARFTGEWARRLGAEPVGHAPAVEPR